MSKAKGKHAEKDKELSPTASVTMADISSLLDEHRAARSADFKSSFESLASTLDSIHSTITDHGQRIDSLETNAISADERLQLLEDACSALQKDESLKLKVADLAGRSRRQNVRIIGLPESIEGPLICEARKRGSLLYKGHTICLFDDYSPDVLKQRVEYRGPMAELYKLGYKPAPLPSQTAHYSI